MKRFELMAMVKLHAIQFEIRLLGDESKSRVTFIARDEPTEERLNPGKDEFHVVIPGQVRELALFVLEEPHQGRDHLGVTLEALAQLNAGQAFRNLVRELTQYRHFEEIKDVAIENQM